MRTEGNKRLLRDVGGVDYCQFLNGTYDIGNMSFIAEGWV